MIAEQIKLIIRLKHNLLYIRMPNFVAIRHLWRKPVQQKDFYFIKTLHSVPVNWLPSTGLHVNRTVHLTGTECIFFIYDKCDYIKAFDDRDHICCMDTTAQYVFLINSALYFLYSSVIVIAVVKRSEYRLCKKNLLQGF